MTKKFIAFVLALSQVATHNTKVGIRDYRDSSEISATIDYERESGVIYYLLLGEGVRADRAVIQGVLKAVDKYTPRFFPGGPFTRNDFIAMAWLESGFSQFEGGSHGERGVFQIMPDEFESYGVKRYFYGINTNTLMAFRVLRDKYAIWHDYKRAIIAYNGVVRDKNGKWSERYWLAFKKRKDKVDSVMSEKEQSMAMVNSKKVRNIINGFTKQHGREPSSDELRIALDGGMGKDFSVEGSEPHGGGVSQGRERAGGIRGGAEAR